MGTFITILIAVGVLVWLISRLTGSSAQAEQSPRRVATGRVQVRVGGPGYRARGRSPKLDPAKLAQQSQAAWVPPGGQVQVAGRVIQGGMVYAGKKLAPVGGWDDAEPALIDPSLQVARRAPPSHESHMGYWPCYSEIPPQARASYLDWLAGGRSDPGADVGYVFLFFYGLERRLMFDLRHLPDRRGEADMLLSELERLHSIYGSNRSFARYCSALIDTAGSLWSSTKAYDRSPSMRSTGQALPDDVRVAVGQLIADGKAIPAEWALAWALGDPETRVRTPAKRCPKEFRELFAIRFESQFPSGMKLKENKRRLKLSYQPASASFSGAIDLPFDHLPDVGGLSKPVRVLREIAETAMTELDGYSRLVGKNPEKADSVAGLALLPPELSATRESPEAEAIKAWLGELVGEQQSVVTNAAELTPHWECAQPDKMSKRELGSFAQMLATMSFGIEPDPRLGGGGLSAERKIVIFRLGEERMTAPSQAYRSATLLLHLASMVAASDGEISAEEEEHLEKNLEQSMRLTDAEARRLRAHLKWLLAEQPSLSGLKRRVESVDASKRHALGEFALATAAADGVIDPGEIKALKRIYRLLDLDPELVYRDIHEMQVSGAPAPATTPVTVRASEASADGYDLPGRPSRGTPEGREEFRLDMDRVRQTIADTEVVASVLATVFIDEDDAEVPGDASQVQSESIAGLDAAHSALLRSLTGQTELSRSAFEELAERYGLLPDGAYETLNEVAFEAHDEQLLDGDDPVEVDLEILTELTA